MVEQKKDRFCLNGLKNINCWAVIDVLVCIRIYILVYCARVPVFTVVVFPSIRICTFIVVEKMIRI